jgi:hypothetical protein
MNPADAPVPTVDGPVQEETIEEVRAEIAQLAREAEERRAGVARAEAKAERMIAGLEWARYSRWLA